MFRILKIWLVKTIISSIAARIDANIVLILAFDIVMKYENTYGTEARDNMFSMIRDLVEYEKETYDRRSSITNM